MRSEKEIREEMRKLEAFPWDEKISWKDGRDVQAYGIWKALKWVLGED